MSLQALYRAFLSGENVLLTLLPGGNNRGYFRLDANTGILSVARPLVLDMASTMFDLHVEARNPGDSPSTDTTRVSARVVVVVVVVAVVVVTVLVVAVVVAVVVVAGLSRGNFPG